MPPQPINQSIDLTNISIDQLISTQDKDNWKKLNQRIGEKCFIVGNELYGRHSSVLKWGVTEKLTSTVSLSVDQANTITGLKQMAQTVVGKFRLDSGELSV